MWQVSNKRTIQRTQYYPSGLPWAEGLVPSEQPYKYNGKEFIQMSGYDTYDYGARGYYPAMGRFSMSVDPMAELKPWQSPYMYCSGNPVNRTDPTGMIDEQPIRTIGLSELTVTATNNNSSSSFSPSAQFVNNASTNTVQTPRITLPSPVFNLPANTNNIQQNSENKTEPQNKQLAEALDKINKILSAAGLGTGAASVIVKYEGAIPKIAVIFKGGGALAALGSIGTELTSQKLGFAGVALTFIVDVGNIANGAGSWAKTGINLGMGIVGVYVPVVGLVYIVLDHYGAIDGAIDIISSFGENHPSNYQNPVCPQDNTKNVIPLYSH